MTDAGSVEEPHFFSNGENCDVILHPILFVFMETIPLQQRVLQLMSTSIKKKWVLNNSLTFLDGI